MTEREQKESENDEKAIKTAIKEATDIISGDEDMPQKDGVLKLVEILKKEDKIGLARQLLQKKKDNIESGESLSPKFYQKLSLCTYKDPDLPVASRLERAFAILNEKFELKTTNDAETLGQAGGIFKRKWEWDGQRQNLEQSFYYYYRGFKNNPGDFYTGINAAYILDLLSYEEWRHAKKSGVKSLDVKKKERVAKCIREKILQTNCSTDSDPSKENWWFRATMAEACFGLEKYDQAKTWLGTMKEIVDLGTPAWQIKSTLRQMASIAQLKCKRLEPEPKVSETPAWNVLKEFLGDNEAAVRTVFSGKVGLALSGGGFRAALFHIGVLARLAELDMLRHVEVISCVSGGSVIGTSYYLEVRKLLQTIKNVDIEKKDYIDIVKRLRCNFLKGVQKNLRIRLFTNFWSNFKMLFFPNYSRCDRLGELFEQELYSRVGDECNRKKKKRKEKKNKWWLDDSLYIYPLGPEEKKIENFSPKKDNWLLKAKVPVLVLNATTLNTGHNWQFTASWMGEPPNGIIENIDANYRLRRMYHTVLKENKYTPIRLGRAVAASACVPGIFPPVSLKNIYPDLTVQLVDGGVHDNQGIEGLLDQDCTVMLVSDAGGWIPSWDYPTKNLLRVPLRANNIMMARIRQTQFQELMVRLKSSLLKGLMYVHLKKDLDVKPRDWIGCKKNYYSGNKSTIEKKTDYGVLKEAQEKLAEIRTDLDSFTDMEAYALMASGYLMTDYEFPRTISGFDTSNSKESWEFLKIEQSLKKDENYSQIKRILEVGKSKFLKFWKLMPFLGKRSKVIGILGSLAAIVWGFLQYFSLPILVQLLCVLRNLVLVIGGILAVVFLLSWGHLILFDWWYLKKGKIE